MRITLSGGANLLAFASKLTSTCVSRCSSPRITGHSVVSLDLDALAALRDQRLDELAGRDDDVVEHDVLLADRELAGLDAHALEQVVDEPGEPLRAALQRRRRARAAPSTLIVPMPSRSSSIDASCAASGVRNSCEMFASTVSRVRRTASSSVSSRSTCTCKPSADGGALAMTTRRGLSSSNGMTCSSGAPGAAAPRLDDGARVLARPAALRVDAAASARRRRTCP